MHGMRTLILDFRFWGFATQEVQQAVLDCFHASLKDNWKAFAQSVRILHLIEWVQFVYSDHFVIKMEATPPYVPSCFTIAANHPAMKPYVACSRWFTIASNHPAMKPYVTFLRVLLLHSIIRP